MTGTLSILNVGSGDTKITFDKNNPAETIRAGRIIRDMLRRGYALLVEVERDGVKAFERAKGFDENTCEYIIADFDSTAAAFRDDNDYVDEKLRKEGLDDGPSIENQANNASVPDGEGGKVPGETPKRGRPRGSGKGGRVSAESTRAVGVARSAGG